jgi:hypothetical protein
MKAVSEEQGMPENFMFCGMCNRDCYEDELVYWTDDGNAICEHCFDEERIEEFENL